jgi:hypothetical protein
MCGLYLIGAQRKLPLATVQYALMNVLIDEPTLKQEGVDGTAVPGSIIHC